MISSRIGADVFLLWSLPHVQARGLVPQSLKPVDFDGRGWIACAAVDLRRVRILGCPLMGTSTVGAWLALVDLGLGAGGRRGNLFLSACTPSAMVRGALRWISPSMPVLGRGIALERSTIALTVRIDQEIDASRDLASGIPERDQARLAALFATHRSGLALGRAGTCISDVLKQHWRTDPHPARIRHARFAEQHGARFEFAFDASDDHAIRMRPRPLG